MIHIYTVLPYTRNYTKPRSKKLRSFFTYEDALEYAQSFKCVEIVTQPMELPIPPRTINSFL